MRKLILTQTSGSYENLRQLIYPNMKEYAKRLQADFFPIEECKNTCPVMEKLRIYEFFEIYDRIIFLDGDLIVRPDAPNLFDIVPEGSIAGYNEGTGCKTVEEMYDRLLSMVLMAKFFELPTPVFDEPFFSFFNAGVIVADKCHKEIFKEPKVSKNPQGVIICPEQVYINYQILQQKPKTYSLPVCFNQMPWNWNQGYQADSYIVHYAGLPMQTRIPLMQRDLLYWKNKFHN